MMLVFPTGLHEIEKQLNAQGVSCFIKCILLTGRSIRRRLTIVALHTAVAFDIQLCV